MAHEPYRGALIGCGFFAANHLHAWDAIDGAEIVAVCDLDPARAEDAATRFGVARAYSDAAELLATEELDFVDIATTAPTHRALVEQAVGHARLVICQKPFAETREDASAMVRAADAAGVVLLVHENFRWQRPFVAARELIESGRIGTPHFARFSFRHGFDNYVNQPYLAQVERFTIMDVGLHLFDLARLFLGEADTLSCTTQRLNPRVRGEDAFTALLRHRGGATSICDCSFASVTHPEPFPHSVAWIEGDSGSLGIDADGQLHLHDGEGITSIDAAAQVPDWGEKPWHTVQDSVLRFQNHAIEVLAGRADPQPSGADNLRTLTLALAAYDAAAERRLIKIAETLL